MRILPALSLLAMLSLLSVPVRAGEWRGWQIPDWLNASLEPASNTEGGYWKLVEARHVPYSSESSLHHIFVQAYASDGSYPEHTPWHVVNGGDFRLMTKAPPDFADYQMYNCYAPQEGQSGGYTAYMGDTPERSDKVVGMGLPYCQHESFYLVWEWQGASPVPAGYQVYLPLVSKP